MGTALSAQCGSRLFYSLGANQFRLDNLLGAISDAVHAPYLLHLRLPLQVLGHALGLHYLSDDALERDSRQNGYKTTAYTADGEEYCDLYIYYENKHLRLSASNDKHPFYNTSGEALLLTTDGSIAVNMNSGSQPYRMVLTPVEG